jgi:peptidoglycan-associated lipoprotein
MTQAFRPHYRSILISACSLALLVAGCSKKPTLPPPSTYTPPPSATKPTASISADRTSINKGDSVKLSWTTTDAPNVSIAPEVGAVTAQGTTTVTPGDTTTYTITASNTAGNANASVTVSVAAPAAPAEAPSLSEDELFMKEVRDAYFDYDSAEIRPDARQALAKTADFLKSHTQYRVNIEGHCDERGSTEYNLALGVRRANAVRAYLVSLGISGDRLNPVSFGKEKPFCMQATEECYAQNRRGHFVPAKP